MISTRIEVCNSVTIVGGGFRSRNYKQLYWLKNELVFDGIGRRLLWLSVQFELHRAKSIFQFMMRLLVALSSVVYSD